MGSACQEPVPLGDALTATDRRNNGDSPFPASALPSPARRLPSGAPALPSVGDGSPSISAVLSSGAPPSPSAARRIVRRSSRAIGSALLLAGLAACDAVTSPEAGRAYFGMDHQCIVPTYTLEGNPCVSLRIETRPSESGTLVTVWVRNDQGTPGLPGGELSLAVRGVLWMIPGNPYNLQASTNSPAGETVVRLDGATGAGEGRPWTLSYWHPAGSDVATRFFIVDPNTVADRVRSVVGCDVPRGGIIGGLEAGYYQTCGENQWVGFSFESPFEWSAQAVAEIGVMVDVALGPASIITGSCGRFVGTSDALPNLTLSELCSLQDLGL